jgi:hypothetical protein
MEDAQMTVLAESIAEAARQLAADSIPSGFAFEALHEYCDAEGAPLYWRVRAKNSETGEKWIRPVRYDGTEFVWQEPNFVGCRSLYNLSELNTTEAPVFLVEGEWCVDKLAKIGVLATTSGGAMSAGSADWSPLADRNVTIWPDNDVPGFKYADEAATKLLRIGCRVRVINPDKLELGETQDAVDWLETHPEATASDIWELAAEAEERSGRCALNELSEFGLVAPDTEPDPSLIKLIIPAGLVAIEICSETGSAELESVASKEAFSLIGTLQISTSGCLKYVFFRSAVTLPILEPCQFADGLVILRTNNCISIPTNGCWKSNVGDTEVLPLPEGIAKRWPAILQSQQFDSFDVASRFATGASVSESWPKPISDVAHFGLAGEFVKLVGPETEADPSALLVAFLTGVGAMPETSTYVNVSSTKHSTNLFATLVGESAQARKGTATTEVVQFLYRIDPEFNSRIISGVSSGEGVIERVRDPRSELTPGKHKGEPPELKLVDAGVADKRLLVLENEFAQPLQSMARTGNTLSPVLRLAWDGQPLSVVARSNKDRCQQPHVALLASITTEELKRLLSSADRANGFGNRFLWVCTQRARVLPFGGNVDSTDLSDLAAKVRLALEWAQGGRHITWGDDAKENWKKFYGELANRVTTGLYGRITSRAEAQVLRIALIYAVLEKSMYIRLPHLNAAIEIWRYCDESARYIFGSGFSRDTTEETILKAVRSRPTGIAQTEISDLFKRHKTSEQLRVALQSLQVQDLIHSKSEQTNGRSALIWFAS